MATLFIKCYRNYFFDKTKLRNIVGNEISLVKTQTKLTSLINPGRSSKTQFNSNQCTNLFMYLFLNIDPLNYSQGEHISATSLVSIYSKSKNLAQYINTGFKNVTEDVKTLIYKLRFIYF